MFLIPSITGIFLFMVPIRHGVNGFFDPNGDMTIIVKLIADGMKNGIGYDNVAFLCGIILTISAVMSIWSLKKPRFLMNSSLLEECFVCSPVWVIIRATGCIFVWITWYFSDFCDLSS